MTRFNFNVISNDGQARLGQLCLKNADVWTPTFLPVATKGTIKGLEFESNPWFRMSFPLILCNSWHLWLRPGLEIIQRAGSLHSFINWSGSILTDSGGFQVFSLGKLRSISREGVKFKSLYNGQEVFLTPELSAQIQSTMRVDIAMPLDVCSDQPFNYKLCHEEMLLTQTWLERFIEVVKVPCFGIIQGGIFESLREKSLNHIVALPVSGLAVGGLAIGERKIDCFRVLKFLADKLPSNKPRYVMGLGQPFDVLLAVNLGYDMFDCVLPTRAARFGRAFIMPDLDELQPQELWINLKNAKYSADFRPISSYCRCLACSNHSRAYIHHLLKSEEMLGGILLTIHNLAFYFEFFKTLRSSVENKSLRSVTHRFLEAWLRSENFRNFLGEDLESLIKFFEF
jgi:queuine tRNA-ribosyltransferase